MTKAETIQKLNFSNIIQYDKRADKQITYHKLMFDGEYYHENLKNSDYVFQTLEDEIYLTDIQVKDIVERGFYEDNDYRIWVDKWGDQQSKPKPMYVTFRADINSFTEHKKRRFAVECLCDDEVRRIASDVYSYDGVNYIYINKSGRLSKDVKVYSLKDYYERFWKEI